jgi:hypothetical protein
MAECDIFFYISTRVEMMGTRLIKSYLDTLLGSHLSNASYVQIIPLLLSVSYTTNKESGNTQYFI